jgi:hypothetical protein
MKCVKEHVRGGNQAKISRPIQSRDHSDSLHPLPEPTLQSPQQSVGDPGLLIGQQDDPSPRVSRKKTS